MTITTLLTNALITLVLSTNLISTEQLTDQLTKENEQQAEQYAEKISDNMTAKSKARQYAPITSGVYVVSDGNNPHWFKSLQADQLDYTSDKPYTQGTYILTFKNDDVINAIKISDDIQPNK